MLGVPRHDLLAVAQLVPGGNGRSRGAASGHAVAGLLVGAGSMDCKRGAEVRDMIDAWAWVSLAVTVVTLAVWLAGEGSIRDATTGTTGDKEWEQ